MLRDSCDDGAMSLRSIRRARGLSQKDLAEMADVEQSTISKIEGGFDGVTLRILKQLAQALDVDVVELIAEDRTTAERALIEAFRSLPAERQQGWLDLAATLAPGDPRAPK